MRHLIGYFEVMNSDGVEQLVVVSQDITVNEKHVVTAARKVFTLDRADGEEVMRCDELRTFSRKDGQVLRLVGHCMMNESELLRHKMRKRRW